MSIEAMKQALEALEEFNFPPHHRSHKAITALRQAIEQAQKQERNFCPRCGKRLGKNDWDIHTCTPPAEQAQKQEPFGYFQLDLRLDAWVQNRHSNKGVAFYTSPPTRQPLTDEELEEMAEAHVTDCYFDTLKYARAIEAAHGIKENT